jgi:hypothetical protein
MKEIFKNNDDQKEEKKGPAELVSFLRLVCQIYFNFKTKNITYL